MTRINLAKYGFVRWPEEDFSDDGNRFTCYRAGKNVRVSKLVADGAVYLSIDSGVGNCSLPYEVYSQLPHYKAANWDYNGIQVEPLTDDDLKEFYEACVAFEQEYEAAEASIKYPTLDEIKDKAMRVTAKRLFELETVEQWFKTRALEAAAKLSAYEWKQVQEYTKNLMADVKRFDPETYPQTIVGTSRSFDFVKPEYEMNDSYWFKYLHELFENRCTN
jgi:hypothetical protein